MTIARSQQISLDHTPYYHCISRCVRRAFLCGKDRYDGKDYAHRRQWLEDRLIGLVEIFSIDLLAYAVMSNHYHVVVRLDPERAGDWSDKQVVEHWSQLYSVPDGPVDDTLIAVWRERLASLSWFMRCVNEPLARQANKEDRCQGRFWEGRFKSQALLDETALLKCMAYVDLNPIRASVATTPEESAHTSIKARIEDRSRHLMPFTDQCKAARGHVPMRYTDYLQLVDWTGRVLRADKRGAIPADLPSIFDRLQQNPDEWTREMRYYGKWYYRAVGSLNALERYCSFLGQHWLKGSRKASVTR